MLFRLDLLYVGHIKQITLVAHVIETIEVHCHKGGGLRME